MKSLLTKAIERGAFRYFAKIGMFICPEVGITTVEEIDEGNKYGDGNTYIYKKRNTEIVDVMAFNYTSEEWYCYEIKISKSDFNSNAKKTFVGNYNYYIMPYSLYEKVCKEIPDEIGCYIVVDKDFDEKCKYIKPQLIKRAKKKSLGVDREILYYSMIKSLYRDLEGYERGKPRYINDDRIEDLEWLNGDLKRNKSYLEKQRDELLEKINNKDYCPHCDDFKFRLKMAQKRVERLEVDKDFKNKYYNLKKAIMTTGGYCESIKIDPLLEFIERLEENTNADPLEGWEKDE